MLSSLEIYESEVPCADIVGSSFQVCMSEVTILLDYSRPQIGRLRLEISCHPCALDGVVSVIKGGAFNHNYDFTKLLRYSRKVYEANLEH